MSTRASLTLVVPCYNEAARLDVTAYLRGLRDMPGLAFCFVDDGSTDSTRRVLESMREQEPSRIDILTLDRNRGKAEAVRRGMLHVANGVTFAAPRLCGFWDADLSAPIAEIPVIAGVFDREPTVQWVWAIRLRALGRSVTRGNLRHYLGRAFATVTSAMLGIGVYDTQCGAKLFRVNALLREVLAEPFVSRWVFDVELLSRADAMLRAGGAGGVTEIVYEQPLGVWHHRPGSKVKPSDFVRAAIDLLRIDRNRAQWSRPIATTATVPVRSVSRGGP
jgi:dolichyl-phosphate beta-glucosyltransferase